MLVTSNIFTALARGLASIAKQGDGDANIQIPPMLLNTSEIPGPLLRMFQSTTAEIRNVTHMGHFQVAMNASNTFTLTTLSEGLWRVMWHHYLEVSGAVADITSVSDLTVNISTIAGGPTTLSRIRGTLVEQGRTGEFVIQVAKGSEPLFQVSIAGGAGTSTSLSRVNLVLSRLL